MAKVDKIVELIDKYKEELKKHYKEAGRLEAKREFMNSISAYSEGDNDAYIDAKEKFVKELEELKEYYSYE